MTDKDDVTAKQNEAKEKELQTLSKKMKEDYVKLRDSQERGARKEKEEREAAMAHAKKVSEVHESGFSLNERGEKEHKTERLLRNLDETLGRETMSYGGDAMASFSIMVKNCRLFAEFLNQWGKEFLVEPKFQSLKAIINPIKTAVGLRMEDVSNWFKTPEVSLPTLHPLVSFNNGQIDIKDIIPKGAIKVADERMGRVEKCRMDINQGFNDLVDIWLDQQGIDKVKCTKDGIPLTAEKFKEIKNDKQQGLQHFLETNARALRFEQDEEPESTPPRP